MVLSSQPIQRSKSLHEQTYEALRTSILSGSLAPGERLVETQLAQRLEVSRTPIREAIRQLQREGLISADGGGLRVTEISVDDAIQLYDCRIALEQLSVAGACQYATEAELSALEACVAEAETLSQHQDSELNNFRLLDLDYRFHRQIAESSKNKWLVSLLDQVFDKMTLLRIQTTRHNPRVLEIRTEHRQILAAIADRNSTIASQALCTHLVASQARVVQEVKQLQQGQPTGEPNSPASGSL